jgi:hypothetical protein
LPSRERATPLYGLLVNSTQLRVDRVDVRRTDDELTLIEGPTAEHESDEGDHQCNQTDGRQRSHPEPMSTVGMWKIPLPPELLHPFVHQPESSDGNQHQTNPSKGLSHS